MPRRINRKEKDGSGPEAEVEYKQAFHKALDFLARRQHSAFQLRAKLGRHFAEDLIGRVESRLAELGYLDDKAFAREYASQRFGRSPRSALAVITELTGNGVDRDTAEQAVRFVMEDEGLNDESLALAAAGKKMAASGKPAPEKARDRLCRFLAGRGFSSEIIYRVVEKLTARL